MKEVFGLNAPCTHSSSAIASHLGVKSFTERTRKFLESQRCGLQLWLRAAAVVAGCSCGSGALPSLAPLLLGAWFRAPLCHDGGLIRLLS